MARSAAVDVHAHGIPRSVLEEIRRNGGHYGGMEVAETEAGPVVSLPGGKKLRPLAAKMLDFEERLRWLDERSLGGQVIGPWLDMQGYELAPAAAADWAKLLNEALAEGCASSEGRLVALGTLPFGDAVATVRELRRVAEELKLPGVMLSTNPGSTDLWDPSLEELWSAAEELGAVVVLHPPTIGPASSIPDSAEFGNLWHRLIDTTLVASRLILKGVLDRHPKLRLVLVHGGGFLPYQSGRFDRSYAIDGHPDAALQHSGPADYLRSFYYDTCVMTPPAIRLLCHVVGADRVVLGSDYPFPIGDPDPVKSVQAAGLDAYASQQVLAENPKMLLSA
ncbi:MAG TPA: amidohydrolase family protein [Chloroflexota bacterium]|nr:amidohydrolase family protein [Chloroflexota bacterium]